MSSWNATATEASCRCHLVSGLAVLKGGSTHSSCMNRHCHCGSFEQDLCSLIHRPDPARRRLESWSSTEPIARPQDIPSSRALSAVFSNMPRLLLLQSANTAQIPGRALHTRLSGLRISHARTAADHFIQRHVPRRRGAAQPDVSALDRLDWARHAHGWM